MVAKALNALHGRWENFWAPDSYSAVELVSPDDVVEKIAYTLANPAAAADLVEHGREWPGIWTAPRDIGGPAKPVKRPGHYFVEEGAMPEAAELVFTVPAGFASADDFRARVTTRVRELEEAAA
ncbi:MAG: hypothetical protein QM767_09610 [Anaeromyxobacter sp.]